ncbi:MAG TPA: 2'-5' RNA ligase family protein [Polyangiaceae bacterium]|nr:2'-5' RNA ligase family protein [Polyangiaceae bacterium]
MPRPNWFFGFPLDGTFVLGLPDVPTSIRLYHPEDVHMTLAFLGGCGEEAARRALGVLDEKLAALRPAGFDATLGDVVPMGGSRRTYSALSALLEKGRAEAVDVLTLLRDELTDAATGRRDARPPKPHVTIARPRRRATDIDRQAGLAWAERLELHAVPARIDRIALYTWTEVRRERLFQIVEERRLG